MSNKPKVGAKAKRPRRVTVPLEFPFQYGEAREVRELTVVRPKLKHFRAANLGDASRDFGDLSLDALRTLLAQVTGETPALIDELDMDDLGSLSEALISFFPSGTAGDGEKSPQT